MKKLFTMSFFMLCLGIMSFGQNTALSFTGSSYVTIGSSGAGSALDFTTGDFTIETWIKPGTFAATTNNYEHTIIGKDGTNIGYILRTGGSKKLEFSYGYGTGFNTVTTTSAVLVFKKL